MTAVTREKAEPHRDGDSGLPRIAGAAGALWWEELRRTQGDSPLVRALAAWLRRCRWFQGKARTITGVTPVEVVRLTGGERDFPLLFLKVRYREGAPETYQIPLVLLEGPEGERVAAGFPGAAIARLRVGTTEGIICDALYDRGFRDLLLAFIRDRDRLRGERGGWVGAASAGSLGDEPGGLPSTPFGGEQSNSTLLYGSRHVLKLYRKVAPGVAPEAEVARFLTERAQFPQVAPFEGDMTLWQEGREPATIALLQGYVASRGDAWSCFRGLLERYLSAGSEGDDREEGEDAPRLAVLLGRRTAGLHRALASDEDDPAWRVEMYTPRSLGSLCRTLCDGARRTLRLLAQAEDRFAGTDRERAERLLAAEEELLGRLGLAARLRSGGGMIRSHGDLHLGQLLVTGRDFVFIDFEGEPARTLSERRRKESPLRDVAGMIRSFHYAALSALAGQEAAPPAEFSLRERRADEWYRMVSAGFLRGYREEIAGTPLVPANPEGFDLLLGTFLLQKALSELAYELNNRHAWAGIPLQGIEMILRAVPDISHA